MAQRTSDETTGDTGLAGVEPPYLYPDYKGTRLRAPKEPLVILPRTLSEVTGPAYGRRRVGPLDHDLTRQHEGEPLGGTHHRARPGTRRRRAAGAEQPRRSLAGQRRPGATPTTRTVTRRRWTRTSSAPAGA